MIFFAPFLGEGEREAAALGCLLSCLKLQLAPRVHLPVRKYPQQVPFGHPGGAPASPPGPLLGALGFLPAAAAAVFCFDSDSRLGASEVSLAAFA